MWTINTRRKGEKNEGKKRERKEGRVERKEGTKEFLMMR